MAATLSKKEATHNRIMDAALPLFLKHGYAGVSIDQLMAAAELTRGGFYAHFKSKQALYAEILKRDYGLPKKLRQARLGEMGPDVQPADAMAYYLDANNREEIARDCPMASQAADVRRAESEVREAYSQQIRKLCTELEQHAGSRKAALNVMASAIGAVSIAGALEDAELATELLDAVREQVLGQFSKESPAA